MGQQKWEAARLLQHAGRGRVQARERRVGGRIRDILPRLGTQSRLELWMLLRRRRHLRQPWVLLLDT